MSNQECSAYVPGPNLCRNGFPQSGACRGATCHGCGKPADTPACMRDEVPPHFLDASGKPKFSDTTKGQA